MIFDISNFAKTKYKRIKIFIYEFARRIYIPLGSYLLGPISLNGFYNGNRKA
jgi:hypothetical protein